jgi:hypothetical protein
MIIDWKNVTPKTYYIPVAPKPAASGSKTSPSPQVPSRSK